MAMETVKMSEYLALCMDMRSGRIEPEVAAAKIAEFLGKLVIKDYMPLKDKTINMVSILYHLDAFKDEASIAAYLELARVEYGLLKYCVNLEDDADLLHGLFGVYDDIREYGLYKHIIKYCQEDYERFCSMLTDSLNISHIKQLLDSVAIFNDTDFEKWKQTLSEFKSAITPEILKGLIELNAGGDPKVHEAIHALAEATVSGAETQLANAFAANTVAKKKNTTDKEV